MKKIDMLRNLQQKTREAKKKRAEEVQKIEANLATMKAQAEAAAEDGNLEKYEELAEKIRKEESRLYVLLKTAKKDAVITPEDTLDAWLEYAADFDRKQEKGLKAYRETLREAARQYEGLVLTQNEALLLRGELAAMDGQSSQDSFEIKTFIPCEWTKDPANVCHVPEFEVFALAGIWKVDEKQKGSCGFPIYPAANALFNIIENKMPVSNPKFTP